MSAISLSPMLSAPAQVPLTQTISELVKSSKEKKILRSYELLSKKVELFYHQFTSKEVKFQELYFFCYSEFFDQNSFLHLMDSFEEIAHAFFIKVREKLKRDLDSFKKIRSDQEAISDLLKKELYVYEKIFSQISEEILPRQLDFIESELKDSPFYSSIDGALKKKLDEAVAHLTTFCCNWDEKVKQTLTLDELKRKSRLSQRKIEKHQDIDLNRKLIELFQKDLEEIKDGPIQLLDFSLCIDPAKKLLEELEGAVCISEGYFLAELLVLINIYRTKTSFERVYVVDQIKGLEFLSLFFNERVGKENSHFEDLSLERRCAHMRSSFLLKNTLVCSKIFPESFIQYPPSISPLTPKKFFRLTSYFQSFSEALKESDSLVKKEKVESLYKALAAFKENELNLTKNTISILESILKEMDQAKSEDSPYKQTEIEKIKDLFFKAEMSVQVVILDPFDHLAERIKKLSF